ncbi:MAG: methyltransferase type 11, partial [Longispora sp.]|nr:methyltransferase type 11 [Longispora sp. (in: high G+C Gram-positive bacteria)]
VDFDRTSPVLAAARAAVAAGVLGYGLLIAEKPV